MTLHFLRNVKCRLSKDHVAPLILGRRLHHGTISCMYTRGLKGSLKTVVLNRLAECYLIVPKCSRLVAEDKTLCKTEQARNIYLFWSLSQRGLVGTVICLMRGAIGSSSVFCMHTFMLNLCIWMKCHKCLYL